MHAADSVWALVSGLPSGIRERRPLMVLQVYIDDSKQDGKVLILAGYVSSAERWAEFSTKWKELLTIRPAWRTFKAKDVCSSCDEVTIERVKHHYNLIMEYAYADICISIPIRELQKVCDDLNLSQPNRNPYLLAWTAIVSYYTHWAALFSLREPVDFYFDDQTEKVYLLAAWEQLRSTMPLRWQRRFRNMPSFRNDEDLMPLQAADLLAWWKRREYLKSGSVNNQEAQFSWSVSNKEIAHFYGHISEEGMRLHAYRIGEGSSMRIRTSYLQKYYGRGLGWNWKWA